MLAAEWAAVGSPTAGTPQPGVSSAGWQRGGEAAQLEGEAGEVRVAFGRSLRISRRKGGHVWFSFDQLCSQQPGSLLAQGSATPLVCGRPWGLY